MASHSNALKGYAQAAPQAGSPRDIEYKALARITRKLRDAAEKGPRHFSDLARAIHENRQFWALLATDVAHPENALPESLRARVFYLAEFTQQHSAKVLSGRAKVTALLEINTATLRGLRGRAAA